MKKRVFFKNAAILTFTALLLRAIGIFYRIYISNQIGAEGMGLYQLIFSVYTLASTIASSGIGIGVTRLIAEELDFGGRSASQRIMKRALLCSVLLGIISMCGMYFFSDIIAQYWLKDVRSAISLRILSFGLPFMAIASTIKGYFMARRKAATPSNSQIFEQAVRIGSVVLLFSCCAPSGLEYACAAVVFGNALSELASCLYVYIGYRRDERNLKDLHCVPKHVTRRLFHIFVPLAASSYVNTVLHTIENLLVPDALTRFTHAKEISLAQFGMLKGMALPLLFFPASFLSALSTLLIPEISESSAKKQNQNLKRTIACTLHITIVSSVWIAGIFTMYAHEIGYLFYRDYEVGTYILALAPVIPFMYLESIIAGILNGLNQQVASLKFNVYNSIIRITLITLVVPYFGISAFFVIMVISNLFTSCLNVKQLLYITKIPFQWKNWLIKPFFAIMLPAFVLSQAARVIPLTGSMIPMIVGICLLSISYICILFATKCITIADIEILFNRKRRSA